jgi:hypothetical protein
MPCHAKAPDVKKGADTEISHTFREQKAILSKGDDVVKMEFAGGKIGYYSLTVTELDNDGLVLAWQRHDGANSEPGDEHEPWRIDYGEAKRLSCANLWFRVLASKGSQPGTANIEVKYLAESVEKRSVRAGDAVTDEPIFALIKVSTVDDKGIEVLQKDAGNAKPCRIGYGQERLIGDYSFPLRIKALKSKGKNADIEVRYPGVGFPSAPYKSICE